MEDIDNDDFTDGASGLNIDISDYLEGRFNFPNSGPDAVKPVQSATGFDSYMADKFRE